MAQEPNFDDVTKQLDQAISAVLAGNGMMPNRWVLVAETISQEDSERELGCYVSHEARAWDVLGLLGFALERERSGVHAAERGE